MSRRSYCQYCSVARALDQIGDRWTLLVVRELLIGPRRYTDLLGGLPGIGTNQLASRLKRLVDDGVIRRAELPPPAASSVYELTPRGRALEPVILGLARWGASIMGSPDPALEWRAEWSVVALRGLFTPAAARGVRESYQFEIDGQPFWARVTDGELETGLGRVADPAVAVTADRQTFLEVAAGELPLADAVAGGGYRIAGDPAALARAGRIFPTTGEQRDDD